MVLVVLTDPIFFGSDTNELGSIKKQDFSFVEKDLYHLHLLFWYPSEIPKLSLRFGGFSNHCGSCSYPSSMRLHQPFSLSPPPVCRTLKPVQLLLGMPASFRVFDTSSRSCFLPWCVSRGVSTHLRCRRVCCVDYTGALSCSSWRVREASMTGLMPCWENSPTPKGKLFLTGF